eukprot:EG_transcript_33293
MTSGAMEVATARPGVPQYPGLADLRWRVDVTISTGVLQRAFVPTVLAELTLTDGTIHTFELTVEQLQQFRFQVANALKDMLYLEKKRHTLAKKAPRPTPKDAPAPATPATAPA